jgi:predicted methyltransferase
MCSRKRVSPRRFLRSVGLTVALSAAHAAAAMAGQVSIDAAIASPSRPAADVARDAQRHPAALLAFAGIKPGDKVADLMPGGGYFTRLFAQAVGPQGHVYAIVPAELAKLAPKSAEAARALAAGDHSITLLVVPTDAIAAPEKLDLVWTSDNYHDVYGFFGPDKAAAMDRAIFNALKPGGRFIVIDHVAAAGASATAPTTLHRIDPATVRAQVLAAGFVLTDQSDVLQNPADDHTRKVFDPSIRGRTDQFAYSFRKP